MAKIILIFFIASQAAHGQATSSQSEASRSMSEQTFYNLMKKPDFAKIYRDTFTGYLGLKWVNQPQLASLNGVVNDSTFGELLEYRICRPHACATDSVLFLITVDKTKAWGKVSIQSDTLGSTSAPSLDARIEKSISQSKK